MKITTNSEYSSSVVLLLHLLKVSRASEKFPGPINLATSLSGGGCSFVACLIKYLSFLIEFRVVLLYSIRS